MTLLPNKYITTDRSLIGLGSLVLARLNDPRTVSDLWEQLRNNPEISSYRKFILVLNYLYTIGTITYEQGFLSRSAR